MICYSIIFPEEMSRTNSSGKRRYEEQGERLHPDRNR
jgi:hypothetical protein